MTSPEREPLQASVRQRLLNIARRDRVDFQLVLTRYSLERLLYRLGKSSHKDSFLLKGAFLFHAWQNDVARPTRDLDLLGYGSPDIARLRTVITEITLTSVDDDGLDFLTNTIQGEAIREASLYDGIRFKMTATLGQARIPIQIDIGFGDATGSKAVELEYPTLLDQEPPRVLSYQPQYVIAEKLEAMVVLGMINTRLKDYYDIWRMTRSMEISEEDLVAAIRATFTHRGTDFPTKVPPGLADDFVDKQKQQLWNAFTERNGLNTKASLADIVQELRATFWPLLGKAGQRG